MVRGVPVRARVVRIFVMLCLALFAAPAGAAEQVTRFAADIAVEASGDLLVTETIAVRAEGDRIRHGLYRDIPLDGPDGRRIAVSLVSAALDGAPVATEVMSEEQRVRIRLGDPARDLPLGDHVFTLTYRAAGSVLAGAETDDLTWEVTGAEWELPIAEASLRLALPAATAPAAWAVATGAPGSGESNAEAAVGSDGALSARALTGLPPGYGMTVRVEVPKGLVQALALDPDAVAETEAMEDAVVMTNAEALPLVLGGVGVVLIYYGAVWWWVGRDLAAGRIVPRPLPPANMSPAAVRYVRRMEYDSRCLAAALVNMAVNGWLTLSRRPDGGWLLQRTGAPDDVLFPEERAVAGKLFFAMAFERGLDDADGRWLRQASDALKDALARGNADRLFVTNRAQLWGGMGLSVLTAAVMMGGWGDIGSGLLLAAILGLVLALVGYLALQVWRRAQRAARGRGIGDSILWLLGLLPALLIGGVFTVAFLVTFPPVVLLGVVALVAATVVFTRLLKAPTADGRRVQAEIEGLAAFLQQAGGADAAADTVADPALPPDRYLPYALALDQEKAWAAGFGTAVAATTVAAVSGADIWPWYPAGGDAATLTDDLGQGLSADIERAAAPVPDDGGTSTGSGGLNVGGGLGGGGGGGF